MRTASLVLVLLGGLASCGALVWLWVAGTRRMKVLNARRDAIRTAALGGEPTPPDATTHLDVLTIAHDVELAILTNATAVRGPLALIVVGVVASTAGGILSLYI